MLSSGPAQGEGCAGLHCTQRFWMRRRAAGVRVVQGDVGEVTQDEASVRVGEMRARYMAAADGLHSPIRRSLGLADAVRWPTTVGHPQACADRAVDRSRGGALGAGARRRT